MRHKAAGLPASCLPVVHTGGPGCRLGPPRPQCSHTGTDMHLSRHTAASPMSTCTRTPQRHTASSEGADRHLLILISSLTLSTASSASLLGSGNVLGLPGRRTLAQLRCVFSLSQMCVQLSLDVCLAHLSFLGKAKVCLGSSRRQSKQ